MKLTIIPIDKTVYINGLSYGNLNWLGTPEMVHALQWQDTEGWIEYKDVKVPNETINVLPDWANNAIEAWNVANTPIPTPPEPEVIPVLTRRQAKLALLSMGLLDNVEAAITTPEQKIWWNDSPTFERSHPLVISVLTALGNTSAEIDQMFRDASLI